MRSSFEYIRASIEVACNRYAVDRIIDQAGNSRLFCAGPAGRRYGSSSNEMPVQAVLMEYLKPSSVFYDIGANVGYFSVLGAKLVGEHGLVFAFEPVNRNAAFIRLNGRLNNFKNISVIASAVSDTRGVASLLLTRHPGGATLSSAGEPPDFTRAISVKTIVLDDSTAQGVLPGPNLVKIDVEGAELQVMRGMRETLLIHRPIVVFEVDGVDRNTVDARYFKCTSYLETLGYETCGLPDSYPNIRWIVQHGLATPAR